MKGTGAILLALLVGGCAGSSMFDSYPGQMQEVKQQLRNRQYVAVQETLEKRRSAADHLLYMMERGRVSQLGRDYSASIEDFRQVLQAMDEFEEKARVSVSNLAAQGGALFTGDSAIPYKGEGYERIFVHQFQALNYLFQKNIEATQVEVRRANEWQQVALQAHEKELAAVAKKSRSQAAGNEGFMDNFRDLTDAAGRVKNSFQNAYSFYLSGLVYELTGEENDAYIDYKKALEIFPSNRYLQRDVLRLAAKLGMDEDLAYFRHTYPQVTATQPIEGGGEIIVLFEQGFAPVKLERKLSLFAIHTIHSVAFPSYPASWQNTPPLSVAVVGGAVIGETSPIVLVQALAAKSLQEKLPMLMLRQVLRLIAKQQMVGQSRRQLGPGGELAAIVFNVVSENADRRSWLTLPNDAQILRQYLEPGAYQLRVSDGRASGVIDVEVTPLKKTIVRIIATDTVLHTDTVVL